MFCFLNSRLDIEIHTDGLGIYCKPINTDQQTHYTSFSSRCYKTAWITNYSPCYRYRDETKIQAELKRIKKIIAWNGFPKWISKTLIAKKLENINTANNKNQLINGNNENADVTWINLPYLDTQGDKLVLSLKRKIT